MKENKTITSIDVGTTKIAVVIAEKKNVCLEYEAAVAGGVPIIKSIKEGLLANKITKIYGILNGTTNYILSTMEKTGKSFAEILDEAKKSIEQRFQAVDDKCGMATNPDVAVAKAECYLQEHNPTAALRITSDVRSRDPFHMGCIVIYLTALVDLEKKSDAK